MTRDQLMQAKAVFPESRSDAIVVSFGAEWHEPLRKGEFSLVIRKRVPKTIEPHWLYFHINAPKSAICARAEILAVERISAATAIGSVAEIALSEKDIRKYLGSDESVGCYRLGDIEFPAREATLRDLTTKMIYHPPQSFFVLSKEARDVLDGLCGFDRCPATSSRRHRK